MDGRDVLRLPVHLLEQYENFSQEQRLHEQELPFAKKKTLIHLRERDLIITDAFRVPPPHPTC
jgi:hypothetical protein